MAKRRSRNGTPRAGQPRHPTRPDEDEQRERIKSARLPETLTELVEQALASAATIDRSKYTPNRAVYLRTIKKGEPVVVCPGGMMLVEQFGFTDEDQLREMLNEEDWDKLHAIGITHMGAFTAALDLTHRLGINRMRESERLQSAVHHKIMTAVGRAMSRHEEATSRLKPGIHYSNWKQWDQASELFRAALPAIREMELFLGDAGVLDKRSTAAVERLAEQSVHHRPRRA